MDKHNIYIIKILRYFCYKGEVTTCRANFTVSVQETYQQELKPMDTPAHSRGFRGLAVGMAWLPPGLPDSRAGEANLKWVWRLFWEYRKLLGNSSQVCFVLFFTPEDFQSEFLQKLPNLWEDALSYICCSVSEHLEPLETCRNC